jgi:hypothetical protein
MVPRFQAFFLCFAVLFHTYLGMIGFVDFQALALALLFAFVPRDVLEDWNETRYLHVGTQSFDRVHVYAGLNFLAGVLSGIHFHLTPLFANVSAVQGVAFNTGVLILIWPVLFALINRRREWHWRGVSVFDIRTPKFLYLMPLFLLFFGMSSYLGLRTAGNFSMFSNLRTEGATSNHIILGTNPFKLWNYQEDTVRVLHLNDWKDRDFRYDPDELRGNHLPVIELRKAVGELARRRIQTRAVFEYDGKVYVSDNITADPTWRPASLGWETMFLDFRVIQPSGPNRCRW